MGKTLAIKFKEIADQYVREFCDKHDYIMDYEIEHDLVWVGNAPGTVACINDMYIYFDDLRYDIDNNIPEGSFEDWYFRALDRAEMKIRYLNYPSYCKGAPDPVSEEDIVKIKEARIRVERAKDELEQLIKDYKVNEEF